MNFQLAQLALEKMHANLERNKFTNQVSTITLSERHNPQTGKHVHCSATIKLRMDEMATDEDLRKNGCDRSQSVITEKY